MDNSPPNTGSDDSEALGGRADGERMRPWEVLGGLWVLATVRPAGTSGTHRSPARAWALWLWCSVCVSGARFKYAKLRFNLAEHSGVAAEQMQQRDASAHVCFTDRRDEQGIDGKWRASPQPPAYPECTVGHAYNGRCPMGAEGKRRHQDFHATSCVLPPMDVQDFAQVIGHGATLWFIGDSITGQMIRSLVCTMRAGGFTLDEKKRVRKVYCIIMTHRQSHRSARVCMMHANTSAELFETLLLTDANAHKTHHQETLVLNFGLHHEQTDYHEIYHALERWQAYRPPTRRKLQLVWRDTSPQHFPEKGGLYTDKVKLPCVPIDDMRAGFEPYENITRMFSEFPEMRRLPIWSLTAPRFDAHNPNECTHWCLPGVPDVWVRLLYALLKAQPKSSPVRQPPRRFWFGRETLGPSTFSRHLFPAFRD
jgi:hypothetical protein